MRGSSKTDVRDDSPFLEQPFRHIKTILIVLTPVPERPRADITFFGEAQTFCVHFELSRSACRASTRTDEDCAPHCAPSLFGLAPCGVCHARCITAPAVRSCRTFSPLLRCRCEWFVAHAGMQAERAIFASHRTRRFARLA